MMYFDRLIDLLGSMALSIIIVGGLFAAWYVIHSAIDRHR